MPETNLDQIQRWLQAVITHPAGVTEGLASVHAQQQFAIGGESVEQVVHRSRQQTALERLQVYSHAYFARLLDCLREEYPALRHAVGDDAFAAFAAGYLQAYPSTSYTLAQLGAKFPDYLTQTRPPLVVPPSGGTAGHSAPHSANTSPDDRLKAVLQNDWPDFLIDLAALERLYSELFDGPGVEGQPQLDASQLAAIPLDRWPEAKLVPVCCLRLITLRFPAHEYISALRRNEDPPPPARAETFLAVTRRDYVIRRHSLSKVQFELLRALTAGQTVSEAISAAAAIMPDSFEAFARSLHDWFSAWTAAGFFQTVELPA